jgi:hypothetical protein
MKKIKAKIQQESSVTNERKSELLSLLSVLESEITKLSKSDSEHAESIAASSNVRRTKPHGEKNIRIYLRSLLQV